VLALSSRRKLYAGDFFLSRAPFNFSIYEVDIVEEDWGHCLICSYSPPLVVGGLRHREWSLPPNLGVLLSRFGAYDV
jgi:hypothetical protein